MTDDLPADLVERCQQAALNSASMWNGDGTVAVRAILREAGVAEMAKMLEKAREWMAWGIPVDALERIDAVLYRYHKEKGEPK